MIRFLALGTVDLRDVEKGRVVRSVLARPKRLALLAHLVLARPRGLHRRDTLLAIFWPELDEGSARHALSQSLYVLRRGLGEQVILSEGDESLGISPDHLTCDAWELDDALAAGRTAEAVASYQGELLEGFHLPDDAGAFERWLNEERRQLRDRMVAAARTAAADAAAEGNPVGAVQALRRATEWAPYDAALRGMLVRRLAEAGDVPGARHEQQLFETRLRDDLDVSPPTEFLTLADEIGRLAAVRPPAPEWPTPSGAPGDPVVPPPPHPPPRPRWALATFVAVMVLGGLSLLTSGWWRSAPTADSEPGRVAILPFKIQGGSGQLSYLEDGMTALLGTRLEALGAIRIADPRAVLGVAHGAGTPDLDLERARQVARRLKAERFILGSVLEAGGQLQVHASLYDANGTLEVDVSQGPAVVDSLFALTDGVARELIAGLHRAPAEQLTGLAARTTSSLPALRAYLEGETAFRAGQYGRAVDAFRDAVRRDSLFAVAWYRLAVASDWNPAGMRAPEATARATELADRLPPRTHRLFAAWRAYTSGDWESAEAQYASLVAEYPDNVEAWFNLGEVRFHSGWQRGTPESDVREAFEQVLRYEPDHQGALLHLARLAALERRSAELNRLADALHRLAPGSESAVETRALRAVVSGDSTAVALVRDDLQQLVPALHGGIAPPLWTLFYARDPATLDQLAPVLLDHSNPDVQAGGHLLLALAVTSRGSFRDAERRLDRAAALNPEWSLDLEALWSLLPFRPLPDASLEKLAATLARRTDSAPADIFLVGREGVGDDFRGYLGALLRLRRGTASRDTDSPGGSSLIVTVDDADVLSLADGLAASGGTIRVALAAAIRASALRASDGPAASLEALRAVSRPPLYERAWHSPFWAFSRERWLEAELLRELGRFDEALRAYAAFDDGPVWDLAYRAPSHFRRGQILDHRGDRGAAEAQYRRFLLLWREADPELQPMVTAARRRLRLVDGN